MSVTGERHVEVRARLLAEHQVLAVRDEADDLGPRGVAGADAEPLADRRLPGPKLLRQRLVDECHVRRAIVVGRGERAAPQQPAPDGLEEARRHQVVRDREVIVLRPGDGPAGPHVVHLDAVVERDVDRGAGRRHAGHRRGALDEPIHELPAALVAVLLQAEIHRHHQHAVGPEPERHGLHLPEAVEEQPCADQHHE
jgi:hypothetical protein